MQLPGAPLVLMEVCNGVLLQRCRDEEMCFTTVEYMCGTQHGVLGWGAGLMGDLREEEKENPNQPTWPQEQRVGTKFVRHQSIDVVIVRYRSDRSAVTTN